MKEDRLHLRQLAPLVLFVTASICGALSVSSSSNTASYSLRPFSDYVWLDSISGPPDTIYTETLYAQSGTAMLHASQNAPGTRVRVSFREYGHGSTTYYDSFDLVAGESVPVMWKVYLRAESGHFVARESLVDSQPTESSFVTWQFWVIPGQGGIEEDGRQPARVEKLQPSVQHRIPAGAAAYDAMGRRAAVPKHGVYFIRPSAAALPRKVLLVE